MNQRHAPARRRPLRVLALAFGALVLALALAWAVADNPRPEGTAGPAADALAQRMMAAIDDEAWQRTGAVRWNFGGRQEHLWDRERQLARVRWNDSEVLLDLTTREGLAWQEGTAAEGAVADELLQQAWAHWCNDSFWLNPVSKLFDEGVRRSLVETNKGEEALLVEYTTGGVTPGDAYLWIPGEDGRPVSWRMWTQILPLGGIESSWEDWITLPTGAHIATRHEIFVVDLRLTEVAGAATLAELVAGDDPFAALVGR